MSEHNGYTNYETWTIALFIDNDRVSFDYWRDAARNAQYDASAGPAPFNDETLRRTPEGILADRLKDHFERAMPELNGPWSALLNAAFSEVDWYDIAEDLVCGVTEEDATV